MGAQMWAFQRAIRASKGLNSAFCARLFTKMQISLRRKS
jgi:hypothetical protein